MRWVLMLLVILAAVMGGEARAVVVMGRAVVSERVGRAETVEERAEALRVESERASRVAVLEVQKAAGLVDAGPLEFWFPGGSAVARSDCGDRQAVFSGGTSAAEYTVTAAAGSAAGSAWTVPPAATVQHVRGPDLGGGTKGLLYSLRRSLQPNEQSTWLPTFNRYNGRGDVVAQSDIDGMTTWAASYQADGRRTAEAGTNVERHRACTKEEDPTGLLNEGFRYRDMETGTFISRDPLGLVDGPNVYCYVRQNPWTKIDPLGLNEVVVTGGINVKAQGADATGIPLVDKGFRKFFKFNAAMHDANWRNFVRAGQTEILRRKKDNPDEYIEWHVQQSAYALRAANDGKDRLEYIKEIQTWATDNKVLLRWYYDMPTFAKNINFSIMGHERGPAGKISRITMFAHGYPGQVNLTYDGKAALVDRAGNVAESADSPMVLDEKTLSWLSKDAFKPGCVAISVACRSAAPDAARKTFADKWKAALGMDLYGSDARTEYWNPKNVQPESGGKWVPSHPPGYPQPSTKEAEQ
jgi:RHS repeat-associated protein